MTILDYYNTSIKEHLFKIKDKYLKDWKTDLLKRGLGLRIFNLFTLSLNVFLWLLNLSQGSFLLSSLNFFAVFLILFWLYFHYSNLTRIKKIETYNEIKPELKDSKYNQLNELEKKILERYKTLLIITEVTKVLNDWSFIDTSKKFIEVLLREILVLNTFIDILLADWKIDELQYKKYLKSYKEISDFLNKYLTSKFSNEFRFNLSLLFELSKKDAKVWMYLDILKNTSLKESEEKVLKEIIEKKIIIWKKDEFLVKNWEREKTNAEIEELNKLFNHLEQANLISNKLKND